MSTSVLAQYVLRFLLGGTVLAVVTFLSRRDRPLLAGIAILFPTITLTSYFVIGYGQGVDQVRETIPASAIATLGYFVLFPVMYGATYFLNIYGVIVASFLAWVSFTAVVLYYFRPLLLG